MSLTAKVTSAITSPTAVTTRTAVTSSSSARAGRAVAVMRPAARSAAQAFPDLRMILIFAERASEGGAAPAAAVVRAPPALAGAEAAGGRAISAVHALFTLRTAGRVAAARVR